LEEGSTPDGVARFGLFGSTNVRPQVGSMFSIGSRCPVFPGSVPIAEPVDLPTVPLGAEQLQTRTKRKLGAPQEFNNWRRVRPLTGSMFSIGSRCPVFPGSVPIAEPVDLPTVPLGVEQLQTRTKRKLGAPQEFNNWWRVRPLTGSMFSIGFRCPVFPSAFPSPSPLICRQLR